MTVELTFEQSHQTAHELLHVLPPHVPGARERECVCARESEIEREIKREIERET